MQARYPMSVACRTGAFASIGGMVTPGGCLLCRSWLAQTLPCCVCSATDADRDVIKEKLVKAEEGLAAEGKENGAAAGTSRAAAGQGELPVCTVLPQLDGRSMCGSSELTASPLHMRSWRRGTRGRRCCLRGGTRC